MRDEILIREETPADVSDISEVREAGFSTLAISNHTEQFIISALRAANALTISLVAKVEGRVMGHIAFSPVTLSDGTPDWYGLGPVSVVPEQQRQGIGGALIEEGLSRLKALNARGCCLVGHPGYYTRFGFRNAEGLVHEGVPRKSSSPCPSTATSRREPSSSTKPSRLTGDKRLRGRHGRISAL